MSELPLPLAAFTAGVVSFLSPCVLPLVPGYVSLISGTTVEEMQAQQAHVLRRVMLNSLMFVAGFSVVFIALGAAATTIGRVLLQYRTMIEPVAGLIIIVLGLHLAGLLRIKWLLADKRLHGIKGDTTWVGAFVIGFAFAFGWTPCIGPILAVVLTLAGAQETVFRGILLLAVYSAGLAAPFLLTSFGIDRFLGFYARFRRHLHRVEVASGVVLILVGGLIMLGRFTLLANWLNRLPVFQSLSERFL